METVAPDTLGLLRRIQAIPELRATRLVGGTALSLLLGHRTSVDLDFFGDWDRQLNLLDLLSTCGHATPTKETQNPRASFQFFMVNGVKVDIVTYPCPWLAPAVEEDGLRLAGLRDIAAMKLQAITNRGRKRDFVDMAVLLEHFNLDEMLDFYLLKYPGHDIRLVKRSLEYFEDAEHEFDANMLVPLKWADAKKRILKAVRDTPRNQNPSSF